MDSVMVDADVVLSDDSKDSDVEESKWTRDDDVKLIAQVLAQLSKHDVTPFMFHPVDWESIKCEPWTRQQCHNRWTKITTTVRYYRTTYEVAMDALTQDAQAAKKISKWNTEFLKKPETIPKVHDKMTKKARKQLNPQNNPDYPKKPCSSAYMLFTSKRSPELTTSHVPMKDRIIVMANEWKEMDQAKKQTYIDRWLQEKAAYVKELEVYAEKHPTDNVVMKMVLNMKKPPKKKKSRSKTSVTEKKKSKSKTSVAKDLLSSSGQHENSVAAPSPTKIKRKRKHEESEPPLPSLPDLSPPTTPINRQTSTHTKSPHKHEKHDIKEESHMPKKAKKLKHRWTGESSFLEMKRESYQLDHPDMPVDEVNRRLKRKFSKISEHKKEKYQRIAEEKNAE